MAGLTVVFGVVAVLFPNLMQALADVVGVTRGTDLLLYGLALVIIYLAGSTSVRFREVESQLVMLARQQALMDAAERVRERETLFGGGPAVAGTSQSSRRITAQ